MHRIPPLVRWLAASAALALAYASAGVLSNELTLPTGFASPMFAPAGIAAAVVLFHGWRMLPAVFVGCLLFLDWVGAQAVYGAGAIFAPAAMAAGATIQAWFAVWLVRRYGRFPSTPGSDRPALRRILLAGPAGSVISPTTGVLTLYLVGAIGANDLAFNWLTWWIGDTFGSALVGPVLAVMLSRRSSDRIRPIANFVLPMVVAIVMLGLAIAEIGRRDRLQLQSAFDREVLFTANSVFDRFDSVLLALEALNGLFTASEQVTRQEFARFADPWIFAVPTIQAIGWSQRIREGGIEAHERAMRDEEEPDYRVFDRLPNGSVVPPAPAGEYFAITYVSPARSNASVLGLNQLASEVTRETILRARRTGTAQASAPFHLVQLAPNDLGVVVYRALADPKAAPATPAPDATLGIVFVSLRLRDTFERLPVAASGLIELCLLDVSTQGLAQRLAGAPDCPARPVAGPLSRVIDRSFAGRHWQLRIAANPAYIVSARDWGSWTLSVLGLLGVTMLGVFLLMQFDRQRRFQQEVETRTRELAREIREREAAESANRAKGEFLSRMSHELRTPLNSVLGFAQLLATDPSAPLSGTQLERVRLIEKAGWHLLDMIDEVLDLARIEAGAMKLAIAPVDVGHLLDECRSLLAVEATQRRIVIEPATFVPAGALPATVLADSTRLRQILLNLLGNAVKYNRDGGSVSLKIARQGDGVGNGNGEVAVSVVDTGPGLSADELERLFVPFDRLGREKNSPGTGIGLVISRQLAESMGGRLEVHSEPQRGSTFTLVMPAAPARIAAQASMNPSTAQAAARNGSEGAHRILCIEDNSINAALFRDALALREAYSLETCATAAEGLAALRARPPDLLVLDLNLPDRHGLELLAELKADPALAGIPVLVVSADATGATRERALAAGAGAFLTKPLDLADFAHCIEAMIAGRTGGA
ncbi:CHASE domain-containing protein [Zeimonas arvi]|uniref:CHASE domain-containing protein n=1 Tax=Zeimonas arvi TaxID=2498847 RepID=UPI00164EEF32|nr:CHASE domain-containing protein [Zeimonas arvi]